MVGQSRGHVRAEGMISAEGSDGVMQLENGTKEVRRRGGIDCTKGSVLGTGEESGQKVDSRVLSRGKKSEQSSERNGLGRRQKKGGRGGGIDQGAEVRVQREGAVE